MTAPHTTADATPIDVAAVYGEPYAEPEECAALTVEEAVAVLEGSDD